jgi:predicted nucleotidyltransferase
MTPDDIRRLIEPEGQSLRARGVTALHVFGSTVAGNVHPSSDIDILVEYDRGSSFNLFDLSGVRRHCPQGSELTSTLSPRTACIGG